MTPVKDTTGLVAGRDFITSECPYYWTKKCVCPYCLKRVRREAQAKARRHARQRRYDPNKLKPNRTSVGAYEIVQASVYGNRHYKRKIEAFPDAH